MFMNEITQCYKLAVLVHVIELQPKPHKTFVSIWGAFIAVTKDKTTVTLDPGTGGWAVTHGTFHRLARKWLQYFRSTTSDSYQPRGWEIESCRVPRRKEKQGPGNTQQGPCRFSRSSMSCSP